MKILLMILSGCLVTIGFYAVGLVTAIFFLSAEPTPVWKPSADTGGLWTLEPVVVAGADQGLERLSPRPAQGTMVAGAMTADAPERDFTPEGGVDSATISEVSVDEITTASLPDATPRSAPGMSIAHVQWCADRYRSYRVDDNRYTPYGGGSRECVSPYSGAAIASFEDGEEQRSAAEGGRMTPTLSAQHMQSCMARYRSYRPDDNSYQPYGGGPRRQCR
ncbi:MAG: BA14K family protein [Mesorhizobium sp.]